MEKELKRKFVMITMSLMCVLFAVFFTATHFYYQYWFDMDTLQFVRWIADSGVLLNEPSDSAGMELIKNNAEYDSIAAFIVSDNGDIIDSDFINNSKQTISKSMIDKVLKNGNDKWKIKSYIYDIKKLPDNQYLIVLADTDTKENNIWKYLSAFVLIAMGVFVLFLITLYLSKFVIKPATVAMQREKQFIADASHELKTPLGAISINAQALFSTSDANKHIRNIVSEADRMSRLIERLLTLSRLDKNMDIAQTVFSLSACVEEMTLTYESVAYDKEVTYNYNIAENISLYGSEDDIRQLMAILIDNAIKNTESSGNIDISLAENAGRITLKVENTGKGISHDDLPHIFERFYKSDSSRNGSSFGLGLAIAKAISERNSGSISVQSEVNGVTCFTVEFK